MGDGTHAVFAPDSGWEIFAAIIAFISSGIAHIPFPICPLPTSPDSIPISTFWSSYAFIHGWFRISLFGNTGPASMLVCISSPVLSKNPVLINTILSLASYIHCFRLIVVLLSSSMIPIFNVFFSKPNASSIRPNNSTVAATSSGPCILGLTIYMLFVLLFEYLDFP